MLAKSIIPVKFLSFVAIAWWSQLHLRVASPINSVPVLEPASAEIKGFIERAETAIREIDDECAGIRVKFG